MKFTMKPVYLTIAIFSLYFASYANAAVSGNCSAQGCQMTFTGITKVGLLSEAEYGIYNTDKNFEGLIIGQPGYRDGFMYFFDISINASKLLLTECLEKAKVARTLVINVDSRNYVTSCQSY